MKTVIGFLGAILIGGIFYLFSYDPPTLYFNRLGIIKKQIRIWNDTISVSSASPSIDISSAGFSTIIDIQPQVIQNSATLTNFAWCNVKSYSTTSVTLNLAQQNNNTVTILGISVLSGSPIAPPTGFSGTFVALQVKGY